METTDAYGSELLHSARFAQLSSADHGLFTELVMGVLRWRSVLDEKITSVSSQNFAKLDVEVITALRLGIYQLLFLDRIPSHAAINDSVELVKKARKHSAAGFVNAVLRKVGSSGREKLGPSSTHPMWLVDRWTRLYGLETAKKIWEYDQSPPAPAIRIAHATDLDSLLKEGIHLQPGAFLAHAFRVTGGDVTRTAEYRAHCLSIQDEASQLVPLLLGEGKSILDCCAAPGGKTRIIAERNPQSEIIALELHPHRAELLKRMVPPNVTVIAADARAMPINKSFESVLVDAPCSGTGTLARNPEIKWRLKPTDLIRLQSYQVEILSSAMKHVSPGGRLLYSTCSLEPEENERVVEKALALGHSFSVADCRDELEKLRAAGELTTNDLQSLLSGPFLRTIPGVHPCDGFFAAILTKQ